MEIPESVIVGGLTALAGYLGLDVWLERWRRRRARPGEIAKWSKAAIESLVVSIETGDYDLRFADDPEIGVIAEWQSRLEVLLADNGIRVTDPELRVARAGAVRRITELAAAGATRQLRNAAARVSRSTALRRPLRPSSSPVDPIAVERRTAELRAAAADDEKEE